MVDPYVKYALLYSYEDRLDAVRQEVINARVPLPRQLVPTVADLCRFLEGQPNG